MVDGEVEVKISGSVFLHSHGNRYLLVALLPPIGLQTRCLQAIVRRRRHKYYHYHDIILLFLSFGCGGGCYYDIITIGIFFYFFTTYSYFNSYEYTS